MKTRRSRALRLPRRPFRPSLEALEDRTVLSAGWSNFAHDPQHSGLSSVASQPLDTIKWETPVDLGPNYFSHYGAPVVTANNTVIYPVAANNDTGFELVARNGATGKVLWSISTDYTYTFDISSFFGPPFGIALTPSDRLVFAGNGGTVYYVDNPDMPGATISGQLAFYGISNYLANPSGYNSSVVIDTPITADNAGNIYFGFDVVGANPTGATLATGGVARIDANGNGSWVLAGAAANDNNVTKVPWSAAPALSSDGTTLYVSLNNSSNNYGYLMALDSTTLATKSKVFLNDPRYGNAYSAYVYDYSTATPMVAPDGTVFYGIMGFDFNGSRGFLLHFSADLATEYAPGAFGWDDTPSVVPRSMVPSYHGKSSYLIFSKYNNYAGFGGGDGINQITVLDPYATEPDPHADGDPSLLVMNEVLTMAGPTPDLGAVQGGLPDAVREWCINDTVVDPSTKSILVNSEDGNIYRWNLATDTLTQAVHLTPGVGDPYTPTLIGPGGIVYVINGGILFALGGWPKYTLTNLASVNPAHPGQPVTFTTTVTPKTLGVTPTGTITFEDGANVLATLTLTNGQASLTTKFYQLANHFITALYSGDANYPAGSTELVESVRHRDIAVLATSANPSIFGQSITLTATVTQLAPGSILPTGKVTFLDGSTTLGDADLINGQATLSVSNLAVGTHSLTIAYFGDVHFLASTSDVLDQVVIKYARDTVALTASNYSPFVGQPVTLTATVTGLPPGTSTPTGTVSFWRGSTLLGTVALVNGQATLTVSNLPLRLSAIHAVYSGDSIYIKNTSSVLYLYVYNDMVVLVSSPNPSNLGQDVTLTATVTPVVSGGKTPTGKVTFYDSTATSFLTLGTVNLNASGQATLTVSTLPAGENDLYAYYAGNASYTPFFTSAVVQTVNSTMSALIMPRDVSSGPGTAEAVSAESQANGFASRTGLFNESGSVASIEWLPSAAARLGVLRKISEGAWAKNIAWPLTPVDLITLPGSDDEESFEK